MTTGSTPPPVSATDTADRQRGDSLVRSEERLQVSTDRVVAGYARLEKFTVTETRTITVEVTHEEVRLVQTAAGIDGARPDSAGMVASADDSRWLVVSREEVVVSKRVVPVERVRLEVYPVTEQREVTEQVRKEQIDAVPETVSAASGGGGLLA